MTDQAHRFADAALAATGRGPWTDAEVRAAMDQPMCRWCREPVSRGIPCPCATAQNEARRIRADRR